MVDRLEPPPRLTGDMGGDIRSLLDYVSAMYQNFVLEKGVPQAVDQPDGTVDPDSGIFATFPIGAVLITRRDENPADYLGYGTWELIGQGRTLVGVDPSDTDFDTVDEEGGSKLVTPTGTVAAPIFTGDALAGHSHGVGTINTDAHNVTTAQVATGVDEDAVIAIADHVVTGTTAAASAGTPTGTNSAPTFTGSPSSVVQPSLTRYFWERTA